MQQNVKQEQPTARGGGHLQGAPSVTEFMTYRLYIQAELVNCCRQVQQKQACLLQLWDPGVDSILCAGG